MYMYIRYDINVCIFVCAHTTQPFFKLPQLSQHPQIDYPKLFIVIPVGHQTWVARNSFIEFDDFPIETPPSSWGISLSAVLDYRFFFHRFVSLKAI